MELTINILVVIAFFASVIFGVLNTLKFSITKNNYDGISALILFAIAIIILELISKIEFISKIN